MGNYLRAGDLTPGVFIDAGALLDWKDMNGSYYRPDMRAFSKMDMFRIESVDQGDQGITLQTDYGEIAGVPAELAVFAA